MAVFRLIPGVFQTSAVQILAATGILAGQAAVAAADNFLPSLECDSAAFYILHDGGSLELKFSVSRPSAELRNNGGIRLPHAVFWQFYDAEEKPLADTYYTFDNPDELSRTFTPSAGSCPPGVYQFRYAFSPGNDLRGQLRTQSASPVAVMPCRSRMSGISDTWVYVPPATGSIHLDTYACTVTVEDETGNLLGTSKDNPDVTVLPDSVIRIRVAPASGQYGISGLPPLLCPNRESARKLHGSIETAPDGRQLAHRFQLRMWHWIHQLKPEDLTVDTVDLSTLESEWLQDSKNAGLLGITGPFNHIPRILRDQILDPADPEFGLGTNTSWLGPAYTIDSPCNPYRGNTAIRNRILLQEFTILLKLAENGTFASNNWNHYAGVDGLGFRQRSMQFGTVAPHIEPELRELWFEGVSRVLNTLGLRRVSAENQTSHWLLDHYMLYLGSGRQVYRTLAHDFAVALTSPDLNTFMETGYQQEGYGPDATYQGLCAAQQAIYYKYSGDDVIPPGLQRVYDLFNHTVAPEPDGRMVGASNFSHRTQGSWAAKQYNAGVRLMADVLPEAAVWYRNFDLEEENRNAGEDIRRGLATHWDDLWYEQNMRWLSTYAYHPWLAYFHRYVFPTARILPAQWPACSERPFRKNADNEFFFVRQTGYYAVVYSGRTSHDWVRKGLKPTAVPPGWQNEDGMLLPTTAAAKKNKWCPTQGLSMFWTPAFGSLVLGKNWNVYTAQMTRVDLESGRVAWPDYWSCRSTIDEEKGMVVQDFSLFDLPAQIHREIRFADNALLLHVGIDNGDCLSGHDPVEQFPILRKEGLGIRCRTAAGWQDCPESGTLDAVTAIRFTNQTTAAAIDLEPNTPIRISPGPVSQNCGQEILTLNIHFAHADAPDTGSVVFPPLDLVLKPAP